MYKTQDTHSMQGIQGIQGIQAKPDPLKKLYRVVPYTDANANNFISVSKLADASPKPRTNKKVIRIPKVKPGSSVPAAPAKPIASPALDTQTEQTKLVRAEFDPLTRFDARTQTDVYYKQYAQGFAGSVLGYASPFYSIVLMKKFLANSTNPANGSDFTPDLTSHLDILDTAVLSTLVIGVKCLLDVKIVLQIIGKQNPSTKIELKTTTVQTIGSTPSSMDSMFRELSQPGQKYAVIFYKNANIFVVLAFYHEVYGPVYCVRNPHIQTQYGFLGRSELIAHLNNSYAFNRKMDIDGFVLEEYSNIQYAIITQSFDYNPDLLVGSNILEYGLEKTNDTSTSTSSTRTSSTSIIKSSPSITRTVQESREYYAKLIADATKQDTERAELERSHRYMQNKLNRAYAETGHNEYTPQGTYMPYGSQDEYDENVYDLFL